MDVICYPPYFYSRNEIEISRNRKSRSENRVGYISTPPFRRWTFRRRAFQRRDYREPELFFLFFFLQQHCFGLQLASLVSGLRTQVTTGSRSTAFKNCLLHCFFFIIQKIKINQETVPKCPAPKRHGAELSSAESAAPKRTRPINPYNDNNKNLAVM